MNTALLVLVIKISLIAIITVLIARQCIIWSLTLLREAGCITLNFKNKEIAVGVGIAFIPVYITVQCLALLLFPNLYDTYIFFAFVICAIGFVGFLDDMIGDKHTKGLRKHIASFLKGKLTTGFIKAFIGMAISFIISLRLSVDFFELILNMLTMALFTNTLNLMDLRPGRCAKFFLLIGGIFMLSKFSLLPDNIPLFIMMISVFIYIKYDLGEYCMLGDTGSNILGVTLGFYSILLFDTWMKSALLACLLIINIAAEKISITKLIEKNRLLSFFDNLGRSS